MLVKIHQSLLDIPEDQWDRVNVDSNPFTSYAFLSSLEESASIGYKTGWLPRYLAIYDDRGNLTGALPMYEKHHSWGEYVFDWAWAQAYDRAGLSYYPKLVSAVPFTPAPSRRRRSKRDWSASFVDSISRPRNEIATASTRSRRTR